MRDSIPSRVRSANLEGGWRGGGRQLIGGPGAWGRVRNAGTRQHAANRRTFANQATATVLYSAIFLSIIETVCGRQSGGGGEINSRAENSGDIVVEGAKHHNAQVQSEKSKKKGDVMTVSDVNGRGFNDSVEACQSRKIKKESAAVGAARPRVPRGWRGHICTAREPQ